MSTDGFDNNKHSKKIEEVVESINSTGEQPALPNKEDRNNSIDLNLAKESLANFEDVCKKSSSLSNSSKQGEGDQHPKMRETTAFYCLTLEPDKNPLVDSAIYKSTSSLNTNTSHSELIQSLQADINNLSFDSIQLSDSDIYDGKELEIHSTSPKYEMSEKSQAVNYVDIEDGDDRRYTSNDFSDGQFCLPHSQKFCQLTNAQDLAQKSMPDNYQELVNESYDRYNQHKNEEQQDLLSESSEELIIINGDEQGEIPSLDYVAKNHFQNISVKPSSTFIFQPSSQPSTSSDSTFVKEIAKQCKAPPNWEENLELQVQVIEPTDVDSQDNSDEEIIKTREYWSNIGLMKEQVINRKYLGPVDQTCGIENTQGIKLVEEKYLDDKSDQKKCLKEPQIVEIKESKRPQSALEDSRINYLTLPLKDEKTKKKKKLVARLTSSFTNLFRSKKKSAGKTTKLGPEIHNEFINFFG